MADENQQQATPRKRAPRKKPTDTPDKADETVNDGPEVGEPDPSAPSRDVVTATRHVVADSEADDDTATESPRVGQADLNRLTIGQLFLHTGSRDVVVPLDGDSAARMMSVFAGTGQRRRMRDLIDPAASNMANLWLAVDLNEVVAISWIPGLPSPTDRVMTVDPSVPDAMVP